MPHTVPDERKPVRITKQDDQQPLDLVSNRLPRGRQRPRTAEIGAECSTGGRPGSIWDFEPQDTKLDGQNETVTGNHGWGTWTRTKNN